MKKHYLVTVDVPKSATEHPEEIIISVLKDDGFEVTVTRAERAGGRGVFTTLTREQAQQQWDDEQKALKRTFKRMGIKDGFRNEEYERGGW